MKEVLFSQSFLKRSRTKSHYFTRNRKLTFPILFCFLLNNLKGSLQDESDRFFQTLLGLQIPIRRVSAAAISKARRKIRPRAFIEMNQILLKHMNHYGKLDLWKGHRVLAIDGSTFRLPPVKSLRRRYGVAANHALKSIRPRPLARTSHFYDVLNELSLDLQLDHNRTGEQKLAFKHLKYLPEKALSLVLMDRGYQNSALWCSLVNHGANLCVRLVKTSRMVFELKLANLKLWEHRSIHEMTTTYHPSPYTQRTHGSAVDLKPLKVRVIAYRRPGKLPPFYLMTTLLDTKKYPAKAMIKLYQARWMVEEDIRVKKCRIEIENFSGLSAQTIQQDAYAKLLFQNLAVALSHPVKRKIRSAGKRGRLRRNKQNKHCKHRQKINRKETLSKLKGVVLLLFLFDDTTTYISSVQEIWARSRLPERPNRKVKRRKSPGRNLTKLHDFHFPYKRIA